MSADSSYDEVPYESHPFHHSHPRWLATVGTLFGMAPVAPEHARVLELGTAAGGNLVAMAESLPSSSCLGIDLSSRQIAEGRAFIAQTGLRNVELRQASILDVDASYGQFDYIVCHGVYSWVDRATQQRILQLCRERLSENGIAYVSYNTYPGWHMKGMLRDMMKFHASRFKEPARQIEQSRALLEVLAKAVPAQDNPYGLLLRQEAEQLRHSPDGYVFHEHLEDNNDPCYFHEFAKHSSDAGLQFLGEAELRAMLTSQFQPEAQAALREVATDIVHAEQYMDFFRNRTFRQSLLCRREVALSRRLSAETFRPFSFASPLAPAASPGSLASATPLRFGAGGWPTATISGAIGKTTMSCLSQVWPEYVPAADLEQRVCGALGLPSTGAASPEFLEMLLNWFSQGIVRITHARPNVTHRAGERPIGGAVARAQARAGRRIVTSLLHRMVQLSDEDARLLELLDGSRRRAQLAEHRGGADASAQVDSSLKRLAYAGLLAS
jgi:SAM-dependent methyltransferase